MTRVLSVRQSLQSGSAAHTESTHGDEPSTPMMWCWCSTTRIRMPMARADVVRVMFIMRNSWRRPCQRRRR